MSSGAPKETGTPIRYPSAALLCVNSADAEVYDKSSGERLDNNYPNRVYINNNRPLMFGYMTRVALTEVNMEWDTPNVNPNNNTITISVANLVTNETITQRSKIDIGWYKPTELAAELEAQLNADWAIFLNTKAGEEPWSVTIDPKTLYITITALTPQAEGDWDDFNFYIVPCIAKNIPGFSPIPLDLTNMLGLTPSTTTADFWTTITGGYASYQYTPYVDIVSNLLTKNQNVNDGDTTKQVVSSKLARLYLSNQEIVDRTEDNIIGCRPFVFRREFITPKQIQWNTTENIDVIDISVLDFKGNPIYIKPIVETANGNTTVVIGNTADFMFSVQVTEV
jgi:hypothetical protein